MTIQAESHDGLPAGDDVDLSEADRPPPLFAHGGDDPTVLREQPPQVFSRQPDESFVLERHEEVRAGRVAGCEPAGDGAVQERRLPTAAYPDDRQGLVGHLREPDVACGARWESGSHRFGEIEAEHVAGDGSRHAGRAA